MCIIYFLEVHSLRGKCHLIVIQFQFGYLFLLIINRIRKGSSLSLGFVRLVDGTEESAWKVVIDFFCIQVSSYGINFVATKFIAGTPNLI